MYHPISQACGSSGWKEHTFMVADLSSPARTIPPIVSVDDHVIEPTDLWQRWLPARFREAGPKVIEAPYELLQNDGGTYVSRSASGPLTDFWAYEDRSLAIPGGMVATGRPNEAVTQDPVRFRDMRPGAYEVEARLADMDINHIERSLCFPSIARFCGQTFLDARDKELALACVRAYNDWMVEEWAGGSGGRLIPLCLIPLWDVQLAAAEVRRNAARGVRAVAFSELPARLGLPSMHTPERYWDPFFAACEETGTIVCMHIGSSSKFLTSSDDAPMVVKLSLTTLNSQISLADWLLSGVMARFTNLKIAYSESQIGWMPYLLERIDRLWEDGHALAQIPTEIVRPPSEYFKDHVFGCFFEDDFGLHNRGFIGIDQITFESDYPHQDSTWPNTQAYAAKAMAALTDEEIYKVVRGNAIKLFGLEENLAVGL
jgi:predicted TIM-barrel fold metal-dependent hydrolase